MIIKTGHNITTLCKALLNGGIVAIPTDTIYGFSCLPKIKQARERIRKVKKRDNKPFIILDTNVKRIYNYYSNETLSFIKKLIEYKIWPGKFTLVAPKNHNIPNDLVSNLETIGIRYPKNNLISLINKKVESGILSTSINYSKETPYTKQDDIYREFIDKIDYLYDDKSIQKEETTSLICEFRPESNKLLLLRESNNKAKETIVEFCKQYQIIFIEKE